MYKIYSIYSMEKVFENVKKSLTSHFCFQKKKTDTALRALQLMALIL